MNYGSKEVATAAIRMAISSTMEEEGELKANYTSNGIHVCATNFGGEFITSINKMIERAVVSANREGVIISSHNEEGAVAGAAREAISQIMNKAIGSNVGGKIAVARYDDHVSVAAFFGIGLLHLNEVSIGLGHRVI